MCVYWDVYDVLPMLVDYILVKLGLFYLLSQSYLTQVEIKQASPANNITLGKGQHMAINASGGWGY